MSRPLSLNERYSIAREHYNGALPPVVDVRSIEKRSTTLANPAGWLLDAWGNVSAAGPVVTDESALTIAAVYACNRVLAESIAQLPIGLYKSTGDSIEVADKRPEHQLISVSPSDLYTSYTFRATGQFHLGLRGNAYARIYRDGRGGARELRLLSPGSVQPFFYQGNLFYRVHPNLALGETKTETLRPYDILHIPALSSEGIIGKSPISVLKDTIGIGLSNRNFVSDIHRNGGRLRGVLSHPNKLTTEQVTALRDGFLGPINEGGFPVLQNGVEFKTVSLTPADAEFISTAKITIQDIARAYRVPLHMIGDLERATFSNIEQQSLEFVKYTLLPWIKNWEAELNRKILPYDLRGTHFFRFNVEGMLRGDMLSRYRAYAIGRQWGWISADEIRALENQNPLPDDQGKVYLSPMNMVSADDLMKDGDNSTDENGTQGQGTGGTQKQPA